MADTVRPMLTMYRRHQKSCPYKSEGRAHTKCHCPIWCDGKVNGKAIRRGMDTRVWARAARMLGDIEQAAEAGRESKRFAEACDSFLDGASIAGSTRTKYTRWCRFLKAFALAHEIGLVDDWRLEDLDQYRKTRKVSALAWSKELQFLRQLFGWFAARRWIDENPAAAMKMPKEPKPRDIQPYTKEEIDSIYKAAATYGKYDYERRRATAIITLQHHYGLRISDAATLRRDRVSGDQIAIRTQKNGATIWAPLYPEVRAALNALPVPKHARNRDFFFWSQRSSAENFVKTVERSLKQVFDRSGVKHAHSHRFRHSLATELLVKGSTFEDVAEILGDNVDTVRRHYAKWNTAYQDRVTRLLNLVHGAEQHGIKKVAG